jgi:chromosome segregation ATPase
MLAAPAVEFKRSIRHTEADAAATAARVQQLQEEQQALQQQQAGVPDTWQHLQQQQEQLRGRAAAAVTARWVRLGDSPGAATCVPQQLLCCLSCN